MPRLKLALVVLATLTLLAPPHASAGLCPFNPEYECNRECDWRIDVCFDPAPGIVCFDYSASCGQNGAYYDDFCRCSGGAVGGF